MVGRIQEETHRFAITYHHESHSRSTMRSASKTNRTKRT